ncbi:MAG: MIP/aquaporin family protein [Longimicrobiales bacterium]
MAKYVTEFIGTFFLVLTIGLTVNQGVALAPLAIGAALMVMVYMGGHVSGAHYNPAVSVAVLLRGKLEKKDLAPYIVSQLLGALTASFTVAHLTGHFLAVAPAAEASTLAAFTAEVLFTFALCLVILNVATSAKTEGNSYYGLAIGFTVMTGAFAVGGISGGAFNPAVGTGPILAALSAGGSIGNLWLYWAGPLLGGVLAAFVFKMQEGE